MESWGSALIEPDQQQIDLHCEMVEMELETAGI
jgi:hypothetical protein